MIIMVILHKKWENFHHHRVSNHVDYKSYFDNYFKIQSISTLKKLFLFFI